MDAELAAEPESLAAQRVGFEGLGLVDLGAHAVDGRLQAGEPRHEHELRAEEEQLVAFAVDAEVHLEIDAAEEQPLHARARGDLPRGVEACGRLDERQDVAVARLADVDQMIGYELRLRQHDPRDARDLAEFEVGCVPRGVGGVHAHDHGVRGRHPRGERGAGGILLGGLDGVFQVDDDRVRAGRAGARETLGPVAGNEEIRTGGSGVHGGGSSFVRSDRRAGSCGPRRFGVDLAGGAARSPAGRGAGGSAASVTVPRTASGIPRHAAAAMMTRCRRVGMTTRKACVVTPPRSPSAARSRRRCNRSPRGSSRCVRRPPGSAPCARRNPRARRAAAAP